MAAEANRVYVIPPNAYLTMSGPTFQLSEPGLLHGLRMPIDRFLSSLAEEPHEQAIAIIVSGTGSDGTLGLRAIKGNGGLVVAQAPEPAHGAHDSRDPRHGRHVAAGGRARHREAAGPEQADRRRRAARVDPGAAQGCVAPGAAVAGRAMSCARGRPARRGVDA
jgi:hypothetical protein